MSLFANRSVGRVGGGIHSRELYINSRFKLPDHYSVFQVSVAELKVAVDLLHGTNFLQTAN